MLARIPTMTIIPIKGIFSNLCLSINIRSSNTIVTTRVVMLKCSKIRLRIAKGLELNCYYDILKKASIFSIAKGKNYISTQVLSKELSTQYQIPNLHVSFLVNSWISILLSELASKMLTWVFLKVLLCRTSGAS